MRLDIKIFFESLFNFQGPARDIRGYSSAGRAPALQAGGQRFDPAYLHQRLKGITTKPGNMGL